MDSASEREVEDLGVVSALETVVAEGVAVTWLSVLDLSELTRARLLSTASTLSTLSTGEAVAWARFIGFGDDAMAVTTKVDAFECLRG